MRFLFVADPLTHFKIHKETTFAMMRQLHQRGHELAACQPQDLIWRSAQPVMVKATGIALTGQPAAWFEITGQSLEPLHRFDAVLMRKDPPFDTEFFYATHLLQQAQREGARVFNNPQALRDHPEKLALMEFAAHAPPTLVTRCAQDVRDFHAQHHDIVLKPLDGMGGAGVFRVGPDGMNLGAIIETLNRDGAATLMAQRYLPAIAQGDKRVLLIAGEVVPFVLARMAQGNEVRANLAVGGRGVAQPLTQADRAVALSIAPILAQRGLLLVGLDMIGNQVTEINVTSPTGFVEITEQTGFDVSAMFADALEQAVQRSKNAPL